MKSKIYLTSSIAHTGEAIGKIINKNKTNSLCFITTGSEEVDDGLSWLDDDRNGLIQGGFKVENYSITNKSISDFERDLKNFDVIHLNGGNSFYLLLKILESGFNKWISKVVSSGKIYIGSSAGAIVASPDISITEKIDDNNYNDKLTKYSKKGIGLVDIICLPHWGSENFKELYLQSRLDIAYKEENKIILLNDYQYLVVEDSHFNFF